MTARRAARPEEILAAAADPRYQRALEAHRVNSPNWRSNGRCRSVDPEAFFPLPLQSADGPVAACRRCPVVDRCLAAALELPETEGVWGGTTPAERRPMLAAWRSRTVAVTR